jgi:hypothetical protein
MVLILEEISKFSGQVNSPLGGILEYFHIQGIEALNHRCRSDQTLVLPEGVTL